MAGTTAEAGERDGGGAHRLTLEPDRWFPGRVPAGRAMRVRIRAGCSGGCDLAGAAVTVHGPEGALAGGILAAAGGGAFETGPLTVSAPAGLGIQRLSVALEDPPCGACLLAGRKDLPPFETEAHRTSVAVWDVPSPVVTGEVVEVTIGVRCAEGCDLSGAPVEVAAASGGTLVRGALGEGVWAGSEALYWTRVEVRAPEVEGRASWEARLPSGRHGPARLPHAASGAAFGTMVASPPGHRLTVEVLEPGAGVPVPGAAVSLGIYRGRTDEAGRATLAVGAGTYELVVWKAGYEAPTTTLAVSGDLTLRVGAEPLPDTSEWEDD